MGTWRVGWMSYVDIKYGFDSKCLASSSLVRSLRFHRYSAGCSFGKRSARRARVAIEVENRRVVVGGASSLVTRLLEIY